MGKHDITKIVSHLFTSILASFWSTYLFFYMILHVVWLDSFGDSISNVYYHVVKIDSTQLSQINLSFTGSRLALISFLIFLNQT